MCVQASPLHAVLGLSQSELEVLQDCLYVGRESVQVCREVGRQLMAIGSRPDVTHGELGCTVKDLICNMT